MQDNTLRTIYTEFIDNINRFNSSNNEDEIKIKQKDGLVVIVSNQSNKKPGRILSDKIINVFGKYANISDTNGIDSTKISKNGW